MLTISVDDFAWLVLSTQILMSAADSTAVGMCGCWNLRALCLYKSILVDDKGGHGIKHIRVEMGKIELVT